MIDLVCIVADKSMEAVIQSVLRRHESLGIRPIQFETIVHPEHDPGCYHNPEKLLGGYLGKARYALVILDFAWQGVPERSAFALEQRLEERLSKYQPAWIKAVVIEPELEAWLFVDSPHVPRNLGWEGSFDELRSALRHEGLWDVKLVKPADPKGAAAWVLRRAGQPASSAIFRKIASQVSWRSCEDKSFLRLSEIVRAWFATNNADSGVG